MKRVLLFLIPIFITLYIGSCTSGKHAYEHGDYYNATLEAIQRLRGKPDHKKSKEVLKLSYPAAVNVLETETQNRIAANDNNKWRVAVDNYTKINRLYEEILRSPAAMRVRPHPVSKFDELKEVKRKAAEESYELGLLAMLKNSREDSKQAYFYFRDANNLSPEYRESIELSTQAKFDATLKVIVQPVVINRTNWDFEPVLFGYRRNEFVRFYTPLEAQKEELKRIDQYLELVVDGYSESLPGISKKTTEVKDSVKTGEKKVNNVTVPIYKDVSAKVTTFTKTVRGTGTMTLTVADGSSKAVIRSIPIRSEQTWTSEWAIYTGDIRALSKNLKELAQRKEPFLSNSQLRNQVRQDLSDRLANTIEGFYRNY
jgi:hypothetical protein